MRSMRRINFLFLAASVISMMTFWGCDRGPGSGLKGQSNASLTFYGMVVDESGRPLAGADFEFRIESIPADWTFEKRGNPFDVSTVTAKSGADGRFQVDVTGHMMFLKQARREGYRHLYDLDSGSDAIINRAFMLNSWSDLTYKTDRDHPAVFVFVKDGIYEASALPCKGGWDSGNGTHWTINKPGWPKIPSLVDVDLKGSQPRVNAKLDLHVRVVDEEGRPIEGAVVSAVFRRYRDIERLRADARIYPEDFARHTRVDKVDSTFDTFTGTKFDRQTDSDGRAVIPIRGFEILSVWGGIIGRRQLAEVRKPDDTNGYQISFLDAGRPIWRSTPERPTVLVLVRGAKDIRVWPNRGGEQLQSNVWVPVEPFHPEEPTIRSMRAD